MGRLATLLVQLALVAVAVPLAWALNLGWVIVPWRFYKATPIGLDGMAVFAAVMLAAHAVVLIGMLLFNRRRPFATFRRFFAEGYAAMVATSLGALAIFLLTTIPFLTNLIAWFYIVIATGYFVLYFAARWTGARDPMRGAPEKSFFSLIFSLWTVVALALIATPVVLAYAYKASQPLANAINNLKARLSRSDDLSYSLADAFPGQSFDQPMMFVFEPGEGSILALSRTGIVTRHYTSGDAPAEVLLDLSDEVGFTGAEMGAYSLTLHPDYGTDGAPNSGRIFLYYTATNDAGQFNRLVRYDIGAESAAAREATRAVLWDIGRPATGAHNGGGLLFGPDGFLYVSLGDFNTRSLSQQVTERLTGGLFRIDPDMRGGTVSTPIRKQPLDAETANYFIPTDNPWSGQDGVLEEYWALGFRNPWRMTYDAEDGAIWLSDVGWNTYEEHDRVTAGDNGGWPFREALGDTGFAPPDPVIGREIDPVYWYEHTALMRAAMAGVIYRGSRFPELAGHYIFADNMAATIHALDPRDPMASARVIGRGGQYGQLGMTSITTDSEGEIYFTFLGRNDEPTGQIARLVRGAAVEAGDAEPQVALGQDVDTLFESVCGRCHGPDGRGEPDMDLGQPRPDFTSRQWQDGISDADLLKVITEGGEAVGKSPIMPAWEGVLSAEEIEQMAQKVRSFAP